MHKHERGLSKKTQMLYFTIFITRYLDLLDHKQRTYLVVFKLTYIISTGLTLVLFQAFGPVVCRPNARNRTSVRPVEMM